MEKYKKLHIVGRGAFGIVYLCERVSDGQLVIMKQIPMEQLTPEERQASLNESKVLSLLSHPNIISYFENFLEDKSIVIIMEYAPGGTLYNFLRQRKGKPLTEKEVLGYFAQLLLALQHVHSQQVLHRDLTSSNLLLSRSFSVLKMGDFGISKILSTKSKAHTIVGTPCYISPELCENKPYNQKSDIWALGCILYELLTLRRPFEAENLPALVMQIMRGWYAPVSENYSSGLRQLLRTLLHRDPERRPTAVSLLAHPLLIGPVLEQTATVGLLPSNPTSDLPMLRHVFRPEQNGFARGVWWWKPSGQMMVQSSPAVRGGMGLTSSAIVTLDHQGSSLTLWYPKEEEEEGTASLIPRTVAEKISITQLACGDDFVACISDHGILLTFGQGAHGCLGHGNFDDQAKPTIVKSLLGQDVVAVACGVHHVMALTAAHTLMAWGSANNGRLGGLARSTCTPQAVPLPSGVAPCQVECGHDCTFILTTDGRVLACGSNRHNKLGMDTEDGHHIEEARVFTPVCSEPLESGLVFRQVSAGESHTGFLTEEGVVWMVGSNQKGQLGAGALGTSHSLPVCVDTPGLVVRLACGRSISALLFADGSVEWWGDGSLTRQVLVQSGVSDIVCSRDSLLLSCAGEE